MSTLSSVTPLADSNLSNRCLLRLYQLSPRRVAECHKVEFGALRAEQGSLDRIKTSNPRTVSSIEMLLLLFFLLSDRVGMYGLPVLSSSISEAPTQDLTIDIASTAGAYGKRSLWVILWSCLTTTFTCTWISVHPNIPFIRESKISSESWRTYFMFLSLIAPEIMLLWAFKQLQGAFVVMRTVNKSLDAAGGVLSTYDIFHEN